jgi:hypothetical protein
LNIYRAPIRLSEALSYSSILFEGVIGESFFYCPDEELSRDPTRPNIFEGTTATHIPAGQMMYSFVEQMQTPTPAPADMTGYTEAVGYLIGDDSYTGTFYGAADLTFRAQQAPIVKVEVAGTFQLKLAQTA